MLDASDGTKIDSDGAFDSSSSNITDTFILFFSGRIERVIRPIAILLIMRILFVCNVYES
jgi:hypothetical protein